MGQSQSQSSVGDDCDGCYPGGYGAGASPGGQYGPWQQPGYGTPGGGIGGRVAPGAITRPAGAGDGILGGRGTEAGQNGGRGYRPETNGYGRPGVGGVVGGPGFIGGADQGRGIGGVRPVYGSNGGRGAAPPSIGGVGDSGYTVPSGATDQGYVRPGAANGHTAVSGIGSRGYHTPSGGGYGIQPVGATDYRTDGNGHQGTVGGRPGYGLGPSHTMEPGYGNGIHRPGGVQHRPISPSGSIPIDSHHTQGGVTQPISYGGHPSAPGHHGGTRVPNGRGAGQIPMQHHRPSTPEGHHFGGGAPQHPSGISGEHDTHTARGGVDGRHGMGGRPSPPGTHFGAHIPSGHGGHVSPSPGMYPSGHGVPDQGRHHPGGDDGYGQHPSGHGGVSTGRGVGPSGGAVGPGGVGVGPGGRGGGPRGGYVSTGVGSGSGSRGLGPSGSGLAPAGLGLRPGGRGVGPSGGGITPGVGVRPGGRGVGPSGGGISQGVGAGPGGRGVGPSGGGISQGVGVGPGGRGAGPSGGGISQGVGVGPGGRGVGPSGGGISPGGVGIGAHGRDVGPSGGGIAVGPGGRGVGPSGGGISTGQGVGPTGRGRVPSIGGRVGGRPDSIGLGPGGGYDPSGGIVAPEVGGRYVPSGSGGYRHSGVHDTAGGHPGQVPSSYGRQHGMGEGGTYPDHSTGYDQYPSGHGGTSPSRGEGVYRSPGSHIHETGVPGHLAPEPIRSGGGPRLTGSGGGYPDSGVGPLRTTHGLPGRVPSGTHDGRGMQRPDGGYTRPGERGPYSGAPGYDDRGLGHVPSNGGPVRTPGQRFDDSQGRYGRPGYYDGQNGAYSLTHPGGGRGVSRPSDGGESQAQSSVVQDDKEIKAGASSQGKLGDGKAQAQVSGTYSGTGSFSAQAQTSDGGRSAQSQVTGNKDGGSSSAQGNGGSGQSQAQVQLSSGNGATKAEAQSGGWQHGSNTQVQAGENGGMADAQSSGPGTTSSQAQVGFKPSRSNGNGQRAPFRGGGTASAQSGSYSGQSQSQVQGSYRYGVTFQGAAQAGSGSRGSRGAGAGGSNGTRFERDDHAALIPDSVKLPPLKDFRDNSKNDQITSQGGINTQRNSNLPSEGDAQAQHGGNGHSMATHESSHSSSHPHLSQQSPSNGHSIMRNPNVPSSPHQNGKQLGNSNTHYSQANQEMHGSHSHGSPSMHHMGHGQSNGQSILGSHMDISNNNSTHEGAQGQPDNGNRNRGSMSNLGRNSHFPVAHSPMNGGQHEDEQDHVKVFKTEAPRQSQAVFVNPMANEDVHITQASDGGGIPAQAVFQPGEVVPGTSGYVIPEGFRGRVIGDSRSIAGDETLAIASPNNGNSQSQTVVLTPGTGKVNYTKIIRPSNGKPVIPADPDENEDDYDDESYPVLSRRDGHRITNYRSSRGDQPLYSYNKPSMRNGETKPPTSYKDEDDQDNEDYGNEDDEEDDTEDDEIVDEVPQPTSPPPPQPNTYVSVTKSVSGQLNPIDLPQGTYGRQFQNGKTGVLSNTNGGKFAHTYYTKSSTCGYFTFSCNVVFGSNGRAKICKPRPPTNPDGSPCCC